MQQFDVCRNAGKGRAGYPYLVIVQSNAFASGSHRVVVPLALLAPGLTLRDEKLHPAFSIEGQAVHLSPLDISSVPLIRIGEVVTSLYDQQDLVRDAIDEMMRVHLPPAA